MQGGRLQMADICLYFFEMFLFDRLLLQIYLMYEGQIRQLACLTSVAINLDFMSDRNCLLDSVTVSSKLQRDEQACVITGGNTLSCLQI